jgi:ribonuclease T2
MTSRNAALIGALLLALMVAGGSATRAQQGESGPEGGEPGRFDYYTLVLSWSPSYCAGLARPGTDPQCRGAGVKPYAFVLHGLWPQYERGYPLSCETGRAAYVPQPVIDRMRDIMPNPRLTIHEYRKHGTCSGLGPAAYYELARRLTEHIRVPLRFRDPPADQFVDAADLIGEFLAVNPGLEPDMVRVACGGPGNRLKDMRFCFTREGAPRRCGANEDRRRLCSSARLHVPPVRPGRP